MARRAKSAEGASGAASPSKKPVLLGLFAGFGISLAAIPLLVWLVDRAPLQLMGGCPPGGDSIALVLSRTTSDDSRSSVDAHYAVFDARTGRPRGRVAIGSSSDTMDHASCVPAAPGRAWIVGFDGVPSLYSTRDATPIASWSRIARAASVPGRVQGVGWDDERSQLVVNTSQGYAVSIDSTTLAGTRVEGTPALGTLSGFHDDAVPAGLVGYYVGGLDTLRLADGTLLELVGHPRSIVTRDGAPLFAGRDFLMPGFVIHPGTRSIEWPDPPSVVVTEATELGSGIHRATRITLDGRVLWSFVPTEPVDRTWRYAPVPWAAYAGGEVLVNFHETGMLGIDPRNGRVRWRAAYRDHL